MGVPAGKSPETQRPLLKKGSLEWPEHLVPACWTAGTGSSLGSRGTLGPRPHAESVPAEEGLPTSHEDFGTVVTTWYWWLCHCHRPPPVCERRVWGAAKAQSWHGGRCPQSGLRRKGPDTLSRWTGQEAEGRRLGKKGQQEARAAAARALRTAPARPALPSLRCPLLSAGPVRRPPVRQLPAANRTPASGAGGFHAPVLLCAGHVQVWLPQVFSSGGCFSPVVDPKRRTGLHVFLLSVSARPNQAGASEGPARAGPPPGPDPEASDSREPGQEGRWQDSEGRGQHR